MVSTCNHLWGFIVTSSTPTKASSTKSEMNLSPKDLNIASDSTMNHTNPITCSAAKTPSTSQISKNDSSIAIQILHPTKAVAA